MSSKNLKVPTQVSRAKQKTHKNTCLAQKPLPHLTKASGGLHKQPVLANKGGCNKKKKTEIKSRRTSKIKPTNAALIGQRDLELNQRYIIRCKNLVLLCEEGDARIKRLERERAREREDKWEQNQMKADGVLNEACPRPAPSLPSIAFTAFFLLYHKVEGCQDGGWRGICFCRGELWELPIRRGWLISLQIRLTREVVFSFPLTLRKSAWMPYIWEGKDGGMLHSILHDLKCWNFIKPLRLLMVSFTVIYLTIEHWIVMYAHGETNR